MTRNEIMSPKQACKAAPLAVMETENAGNAIGSTTPTVEDRAHFTPEMQAAYLAERAWELAQTPIDEEAFLRLTQVDLLNAFSYLKGAADG